MKGFLNTQSYKSDAPLIPFDQIYSRPRAKLSPRIMKLNERTYRKIEEFYNFVVENGLAGFLID